MIMDGKAVATQIQQELKQEIAQASKKRPPCLAVILVGTHLPSQIYVNRKRKACESIGILSILHQLPEETSEAMLLQQLDQLNRDPNVDGILVQLPLPPQINPMTIIQRIDPRKDVDGLHPINAGKLLTGDTTGFVPCTPLGIKVLLERSEINVSGKHVVILGRSNLVGKPLAALLMQNAEGANATVTVAHSFSNQVKELCQIADILVVAMGRAQFVKADMVRPGVVIVDVGINKVGDEIVGDVDFDAVKGKCAFITPVPGGVGPMTIAMLLSNTWKAASQSLKSKG